MFIAFHEIVVHRKEFLEPRCACTPAPPPPPTPNIPVLFLLYIRQTDEYVCRRVNLEVFVPRGLHWKFGPTPKCAGTVVSACGVCGGGGRVVSPHPPTHTPTTYTIHTQCFSVSPPSPLLSLSVVPTFPLLSLSLMSVHIFSFSKKRTYVFEECQAFKIRSKSCHSTHRFTQGLPRTHVLNFCFLRGPHAVGRSRE